MKSLEKVKRLDLEMENLYDEYHYLYLSGKITDQRPFVTFQEYRKKREKGIVIKVGFDESGQGLLLV